MIFDEQAFAEMVEGSAEAHDRMLRHFEREMTALSEDEAHAAMRAVLNHLVAAHIFAGGLVQVLISEYGVAPETAQRITASASLYGQRAMLAALADERASGTAESVVAKALEAAKGGD